MKQSISVLIPCYNGANWIDRCFKSLTKQGIDNFDIIVVDDCSTDNSLEILEKWKTKFPSLKIVKHESNRGSAGTRNTLISLVKTDYFIFLDVDDTLAKNALNNLHKQIVKSNNRIDVVLGKSKILYANKNNKILWQCFYLAQSKFFSTLYSSQKFLSHCHYANVWGILTKKKYWDSLNISFNENTEIEDIVPSFIMIYNAKAFCAITSCIYNYTDRPNSLFHIKNFSEKRFIDYQEQLFLCFSEIKKRYSLDDFNLLSCFFVKFKSEMGIIKHFFTKLAKKDEKHIKMIEDLKSRIYNDFLKKNQIQKLYLKIQGK